MKVNKFQIGGLLPVHTPWQYPDFTGSQNTSGSSSGKSSTDAYEKMMIDVLKDMQGKVLPSEYDTYLKHVSRWLANPTQSKIPALLKLGNQMLHNADTLEKAKAELYANDAAGELARSGTRIYCLNPETENVELLSYEDIKKREKKNKPVQLLKNIDLFNLRANSKDLQFNNYITNDISEAVGMTQIDKFCQDVLAKITKDTIEKKGTASKADIKRALTKIAQETRGKAPSPEQVESFNQLLKIQEQMASGEYDFHVKTTDSRKHIETALNYIYTMMPTNMKEALIVQSQVYGDGNPIATIGQLLHFGTQRDELLEVKPDSGSEGGSNMRLNPTEMFLNGDLNQTTVDITLDNNQVVRFKGSTGYLTDYQNKPLETTLLSNVLSNNNMGTILDKNQIYFGDQKVPQYNLSNFICKSDTAVNTMVPVKSNGDIDFAMFNRLQKAEKQINDAKDKTPEVIQTIYQKNGIPTERVGNEIKPNLHLEPFIVVSGVTTDDVVEEPETNMFMQLVKNNDTIDGYETMFDQIYGNINAVLNKAGAAEIDQPGGSPIEGVIFMKLKSDAQMNVASRSGHGATVKGQTLEESMIRQNLNNIRQNNNFTSASLASLQ